MKTTLALVLFIFFQITSNVSAQDKPSILFDSSGNSLKKGSLSIQFGIMGDFSLGAFNNYSLSFKWHLSRKIALRFGIGGSASYNSGYNVFNGERGDYFDDGYNISAETVLLFYPKPDSKLNIFIGAGPLFNYGWGKYNSPDVEYQDFSSGSSNSIGGGLKALIGAEWFFTKYMSLFAEYEATATYDHSKRSYHDIDYYYGNEHIGESQSDSFNFRANSVKFGLSVYF